jgi:ribokinase
MARVLVVGGINQDVTVRVDHRPGDGETVLGAGPTWGTGGKGANMSVAAARAGAAVTLCGSVGDDAAGTGQLEQLRRARVDVSRVRVDPDEPTGVALIVVTPEGENTIVVGSGANLRLRKVDIDAALAAGADVVIAQAEVGVEATDLVAVAARRVSCRLVLSLAPVTPVDRATLRDADPLVVNEEEARDVAALVGAPPQAQPEVLARQILEAAGCRSVVLTLGARGAVVATSDALVHLPAPQVAAVDTTGAGDVLAGVLAAGLAGGQDLVSATGAACLAAAESVRSIGARTEIG